MNDAAQIQPDADTKSGEDEGVEGGVGGEELGQTRGKGDRGDKDEAEEDDHPLQVAARTFGRGRLVVAHEGQRGSSGGEQQGRQRWEGRRFCQRDEG